MSNAQKKVSSSPSEEARQHYLRGRELWRQGDRGGAITEYNKAVALDPKSPARTALAMANEILDFFDPNQLNP